MRCPYCGDTANRVVDSRLGREETEIRRRRECQECGRRFTTRERVEEVLPKVVKRDERREEYDRRKLLASIEKACAKRPVSVDALERLADRVEKRLQESGETELRSREMGEWVLEELCGVDAMAAARFASVFRGFQSAGDYVAFFSSLDAHLAATESGEPEPAAPRRAP
ncbi:MAG: transcriptional regulator NrdR [Myxococcota bacterium]|nr:transcriptional regulator NrdR [Myxococcota bacterium]